MGVVGGVSRALGLASESKVAKAAKGQFTFVQISDTHVGFHKDANPDVIGTLRRAIGDINALAQRPAFALHTGDITHLSRPEEFDLAASVLGEIKLDRIHYVPGEHDALDSGLSGFLTHYGAESGQRGYYSFHDHGVHFVGLVNVVDFKANSLAALGDDQLKWLRQDLSALPASTPLVVFAHIPLWNVYEAWGWGTADSEQAVQLLRRFGSVTVLNGHIHQVIQKIEGNIAFHTALSTAYPQPAPGTAESPGPLTVAANELGRVLGTRRITKVSGTRALATIDTPIIHDAQAALGTQDEEPVMNGARVLRTLSMILFAAASSQAATPPQEIDISQFAFSPRELTVPVGTELIWVNHDQTIHSVIGQGEGGKFSSPGLDSGDRFRMVFKHSGDFTYVCSLHPYMKGVVHVRESLAQPP